MNTPVTLTPEDRITRDQQNRLRMVWVSTSNYLWGTFGLSLYAWLGTVDWRIPLAYGVITVLGSAMLLIAVWRRVNLRLRDPNLFAPQMAFATVVTLVFLYAAPQIAFGLLASLFVIAVFGLTQFEVREMRYAVALMGAGAAVVFYLQWEHLRLPASTPVEAVLLWVALMIVLGRFYVVASYLGLLRRKLRDRNTRLHESLHQIEELSAARARRERELAVVQERQRVMREIHDGIGAALSTSLATLERREGSREDAIETLRECIHDMKLTIDSLELMDKDLVAAIATVRYRMERRLMAAGIAMEWRVTDLPSLPWLEVAHALSIMRIVQEALANVVKHAHASAVRITTGQSACGGIDGVEVGIADNGVGIGGSAREEGRPAGRGLTNMEARAAALGGRLTVHRLSTGTAVSLWLPLRQE